MSTADATTLEKLKDAFLGGLVFDVRNLDTEWPDQPSRQMTNVNLGNLQDPFRYGIRRYDIRERLSVTMGKTDFEHVLFSAAFGCDLDDQVAGGDTLSLQELSIAVRVRSTNPDKLLHVPKHVPHTARPILQNGQRRRRALLDMLEKQNATSDTVKPPVRNSPTNVTHANSPVILLGL